MTMTTTLTLFELFRQFDSLNHKAILETLAKMDPEAFQAAVRDTTRGSSAHQWMKEVMDFLEINNFVSAIKVVRTATGMGLKEAKDVVDMIRSGEKPEHTTVAEVSMNVYQQFVSAGMAKELNKTASLGQLLRDKMVYIVREGCDNSIDAVYGDQAQANKRCMELNGYHPSSDHYVSTFQIR